MIRDATQDDVPALLALGRVMHAESRFASLAFAEDKVRNLLAGLIVLDDGFLMVAEYDGQIIGGYAGVCHEMWCSHEKMVSDFAFFVAPGKRGALEAAYLVRAFVAWAKTKGTRVVQIGISTGVRVAETTKLYEAFGFESIGPIMELKEA